MISYKTVFRTSVESEGYRVHPFVLDFIPELSIARKLLQNSSVLGLVQANSSHFILVLSYNSK